MGPEGAGEFVVLIRRVARFADDAPGAFIEFWEECIAFEFRVDDRQVQLVGPSLRLHSRLGYLTPAIFDPEHQVA